MDWKDIIRYQYQKLLLVALLVVVGFTFYKSYSAFFKKVDEVWSARFQYDYARVVFLAKKELEDAKFEVDYSCSGSLLGASSEECLKAKERLKRAEEKYQKTMAEKDNLLRVEKQVKSYYDAILLSARQTPLPFLLLVLTFSSLITLGYFVLREFLPQKRR